MNSWMQNIFLNGPMPVVLVVVAFAGLVASLSSCTIARLPIIWGYVAAASESKRKGFLLSITFVAGLIVSYSLMGFMLGAISGMASKLIGISKYLYFILGSILVIGGLFFSGLIPSKRDLLLKSFKGPLKKANTYYSSFIFGVVYAFLEMPVCPCCGAVLIAIASLAMMKGSLIYSGLIFISFAIGQSVPILLVGFSASILKHIMPLTHKLEDGVAFVAGNVLLISGIFLIAIS